MIETPGEHERYLFGDLTESQFDAGMDWLSHEPVSYEAATRPEDGQTWIATVAATPEQVTLLREALKAAG